MELVEPLVPTPRSLGQQGSISSFFQRYTSGYACCPPMYQTSLLIRNYLFPSFMMFYVGPLTEPNLCSAPPLYVLAFGNHLSSLPTRSVLKGKEGDAGRMKQEPGLTGFTHLWPWRLSLKAISLIIHIDYFWDKCWLMLIKNIKAAVLNMAPG